VNCRSALWPRAFTSTTPARSTSQALACRQLPSPKKDLQVFGWSRIHNDTDFFVRLRMSSWVIFYITLLNWEFLLKWYNFFLKLLLKQRFLAVHHDLYLFQQPNFIPFMLRSRSRKFWKVGFGSRSRKLWKGRSWSWIFYLRLRNPGFKSTNTSPATSQIIVMIHINSFQHFSYFSRGSNISIRRTLERIRIFIFN